MAPAAGGPKEFCARSAQDATLCSESGSMHPSCAAQATSKASNIIVFSFWTFMDLTQAKTPSVLQDKPQQQNELLRLEAVTKTYLADGQPVHALNGVTLAVNRGDFVALVGRSGCGKSTLLNLGGAMDFPTTGRVLLDGVVTAELNDNGLTRLRREKVGFIFQSFQLLNTLTVLENVELPLLLAGEVNTKDRAIRQLELVEMPGLDSRMPHQLSGGQMQRVAIARAMVHGPRLLLADEPTGNLDTQTGNLILQLLRRIADEQDTAILMATHSMEAAGISDAVVKMRDGRIEEVIAR
jgi:putative ABC transport system ATP-binding protein